jgi:hypothetical protein
MSKAATQRLTLKQEQFSRNVAAGMSLAEAYSQAYNTSANKSKNGLYVTASNLASTPKIALRIQDLRKEYGDNTPLTSRDEQLRILLQTQSIAASHLQKTRKNVDKDGNETEEATFNRSAADTIVKCAEAINKMCGYNEPDKLDTTLKIEFVRPHELKSADDDVIDVIDYEDLSE